MKYVEIEYDERFDRFFEDILKHEGGYSNDKDDPGGETKYGISKRQYPSLNIKSITKELAKGIYYYDYWIKSKANIIAEVSFQVATKYCDIAINTGIKRAFQILKNAMYDLGYTIYDGIDVEFILKLKSICDNKKEVLINNIIKHQKSFYISLTEKKPSLKKFLKGWLKRADYRGVEEWG